MLWQYVTILDFKLLLCSVCNMLPLLSLQDIGNTDFCLLKNWASLKNFRVSILLLASSICLILLFIQILFFFLHILLTSVLYTLYILRVALVLTYKYFFLASFFCDIINLHNSSHHSFLLEVACVWITLLADSIIASLTKYIHMT